MTREGLSGRSARRRHADRGASLRSRAARSAVAVLALSAVVGGRRADAAAAWLKSYDEAQRAILQRDWETAELALLRSLELKPRPACRERVYGVKYRDYIPHYYLGIVRYEMGREPAAERSFARSLAEGVVESCAATRPQAFDLRSRWERLRAAKAAGPAAQLAALDTFRAEAEAAGAAQLAAPELRAAEEASAVARRSRAREDLEAALRAWALALSRSRTDGPILALLAREAREALERVRMDVERLGEGDEAAEPARVRLGELATRLDAARDASDWLAIERDAAELADALEEEVARQQRSERTRVARLRAEVELLVALGEAARQAVPAAARSDPRHAAASRSLDRARRGLETGSVAGLSTARAEAEGAREAFALLAELPAPRRGEGGSDPRSLLPLAWSERLVGRAPQALMSPGRAAGARPLGGD